MKGLLVGETYEHPTKNVSAQLCRNLYPETIPGGGKAQRIFRLAPGKKVFTTLTDSPASAIFQQDDRCFVAAGTSFLEVDSAGVVTNRGTLAASWPTQPATICSNGKQNGDELFITAGGLGYVYTLSTDTLTQISDPQFPANVRTGHYIDGYFIAVTQSGFYLSDLLDGPSWAGDAGTRSGASDQLVAAVDDHELLWLFGAKRTEVWFDAGTVSFPFEPVPGVFIEYGLGAPSAITRVGNSLLWLGESERGDRAILRNQGYEPIPVSTAAIASILEGFTTINDARAYTVNISGHTFAVFTFPTEGRTLQYDVTEGAWSELGYWNTTTGLWEADRAIGHAYAFGKHLVIDRANTTLWELSPTVYADGADALRWIRRTPHVTNEHQTVFFPYYELEAAVGVGLTSGQGSDPQVLLRVSDDGGYTWGPELKRSLGKKGVYGQRVRWNRMGRSRNRVVELSGSDPVETTLIDLYSPVSVGTH